MVNYCCVYGCGRNNKIHKHLTYYGIPKDKDRQEQWLRAAGREDLMGKASYKSVRLCSRHFEPSQIKKRHLAPDAVPSLCLPGSLIYDTDVKEPETHNGLICNGCSDPIVGFRYKCIVCNDYDLCQKCEMLEVHPEHLMLRINRPLKFSTIENLVNKWRNVIKSAKDSYDGSKADDDNEYQSSDDEPITKYTRENDGGVNLSEEVKNRIRKEIARVLKIRNEQDYDKSKINANKRPAEGDKPSKKMRKEEISDDENDSDNNSDDSHEVQELAFADVDDVKLDKMIKTETSVASSAEQDKDNMYLDITLNSFNFN